MSPLHLANWREINRLFCVVMWTLAVALAVVVLIGQVAGASSACASKQSARNGSACAAGPNRLAAPR